MSWFLVRQDTHGTRFDVAQYHTQAAAAAAMASFEAGYPHHQTYYVEQRYTADGIETLHGLEVVRRRPEMYVGEGGADITELVLEALCLSLTEGHCGTASQITVSVDSRSVEITDDGLGLSLDPNRHGIPFAEAVMTELYACRDHTEHERLKRELCSVGIAVVNALSSSASLTVCDGDNRYQQTYTCGRSDGPFQQRGTTSSSGTRLRFVLESQFLNDERFDAQRLVDRVDELPVDLTGVSLEFASQPD